MFNLLLREISNNPKHMDQSKINPNAIKYFTAHSQLLLPLPTLWIEVDWQGDWD